MKIWVPKLIDNFKSFIENGFIDKSDYFFNFKLPIDGGNCIFLSDGMHLEKKDEI